jgi:TDG/mug DNA glycosylase family protein
MVEKHRFTNFIPQNIKYLILGSFTAISVRHDANYDWYYGSKMNQFWPILRQVYNRELSTKDQKMSLFEELGIGIADIIKECERKKEDSADTSFINIVFNLSLNDVFRKNKIEKLIFTSKFVENLFKRNFKNIINDYPNLKLVTLPSPSPRYAAMSKEKKVQRYREILPKL